MPLTDFQQRVIDRIRLLERKIHQEFGIRLRCGVEREFYYRKADGTLAEDSFQLNNALFNHLPSVTSITEEQGTDKYEMRIGLSPVTATSEAAAPSAIAGTTVRAQDELERWFAKSQQKGRAHFWAIDPSPSRRRATAGMHVNLSLWAPDGANLLGQGLRYTQPETPFYDTIEGFLGEESYPLAKLLLHHGIKAQQDLLPLIVTSEHSLERLRRCLGSPVVFRAKVVTPKHESSLSFRFDPYEGPTPARIEHRAPGADADPCLAILMAVGGIYHGLTHGLKREPASDRLPLTLGEKTVWMDKVEADTRCPIPDTLKNYGTMLDAWENNAAAREILGHALFEEVLAMRRKEYQSRIALTPDAIYVSPGPARPGRLP